MEVRQLRETRSHSQGQRAADDGMTIVELLIALVIVMVAFAALASTLMASFNAIRNNEARVIATALGNELIEEMSTIPWGRVGLYEDDALAATFEGEVVVLIPEPDSGNPDDRDPLVPEAEAPVTRDTREYTVRRWVTVPDVDVHLKRLIVIISWEVGGREHTIRTEGVRSPDPDDLLNLQVRFEELVNAVTDEDKVPLNAPGEPDPLKNATDIRAVVRVGIVSANVELRFVDRGGIERTVTTTPTPGDEHEREFVITANSFQFKHGNVSFTVVATGNDEIASHAAVLRFYQPVEVQEFRMTQDGVPVTEVHVCNGELEGEVVIDAEVHGLTPAEASIEEALALEWGRRPGAGEPLQSPRPDPPVEMFHTAETNDGGDYRGVIEDGTDLHELVAANAFRITAQRRLGEFDDLGNYVTPHDLDDGHSRREQVIVEVCAP